MLLVHVRMRTQSKIASSSQSTSSHPKDVASDKPSSFDMLLSSFVLPRFPLLHTGLKAASRSNSFRASSSDLIPRTGKSVSISVVSETLVSPEHQLDAFTILHILDGDGEMLSPSDGAFCKKLSSLG